MSQLGTLLAAVGVAPALPGARCRGRHHLFDEQGKNETPEAAAERHTQALGLCRLCPSLAGCTTWFDTLPASRRPKGVVAGQLNIPNPPGRPTGTTKGKSA